MPFPALRYPHINIVNFDAPTSSGHNTMSFSSPFNWSTLSESPEEEDSAVSRWIDPDTGKPAFSRHTVDNLETRTLAAAELVEAGFYRYVTTAAKEVQVPRGRLRSRLRGGNPVT